MTTRIYLQVCIFSAGEETSAVEKDATFPSISSLVSDDESFSIPQPSLDLVPTDLAENSPMSFSIPSLQLKLDETDFAKNSPMSFSITQPPLDLKPSFTIQENDGVSLEKSEEQSLDKSVYSAANESEKTNERRKRQGELIKFKRLSRTPYP